MVRGTSSRTHGVEPDGGRGVPQVSEGTPRGRRGTTGTCGGRHQYQQSRLLRVSCTRGSRSRNILGKAAIEECRPALPLTVKAPRESCRRRIRTEFRREGPQRTRSGASGNELGGRRRCQRHLQERGAGSAGLRHDGLISAYILLGYSSFL